MNRQIQLIKDAITDLLEVIHNKSLKDYEKIDKCNEIIVEYQKAYAMSWRLDV